VTRFRCGIIKNAARLSRMAAQVLTRTMQICLVMKKKKAFIASRCANVNAEADARWFHGYAPSTDSEILITVLSRLAKQLYRILRVDTRRAPRTSSVSCPSDARAWRKWPLDQGPARLRNFHRVGGYPLFRITGSLREVRSCRPSAGWSRRRGAR